MAYSGAGSKRCCRTRTGKKGSASGGSSAAALSTGQGFGLGAVDLGVAGPLCLYGRSIYLKRRSLAQFVSPTIARAKGEELFGIHSE